MHLDDDDAITSLGGTDANLEHDTLDRLDDHKVDGSRTTDEPVEPVEPVVNQPSEINAYWTQSDTKGSNLQVACASTEPFRAFWLPPVKSVTGNTSTYKVADEWEAEVTSENGASGERYTIRNLDGRPEYPELTGTVRIDSSGWLSIRVRGRFGADGWGAWSPRTELYCTSSAIALEARFVSPPAQHDGSKKPVKVQVAFSEAIDESPQSVGEHGVQVKGGEVISVRTVGGQARDGRNTGEVVWDFEIEPGSDDDLTMRIDAGRSCDEPGAICTPDGRSLSKGISTTVRGPEPERNTAAAGTPAISGTPQVGEELTASTSGISDADGLDNASFGYQWIRTGADIGGATGSTYTPVLADEGKKLKVRVSFTDDAGNDESLTSAATDAVAAPPEPLTASFEGMPAEHAGQGSFSFRVAFSEGINISYKTVRDASFRVTGGDVTRASRVDRRRDLWKITIEPHLAEAVTVRLPETTDCDASGAICTGDGRPLSHSLSATVAGPVGIAVADARLEEGDGVALAFAVMLSRAASAALTVDYATADGSAHAGDDYTAASGTLRFAAGERSKTIDVGVFDDAHDEGEETLTLTLSHLYQD